MKLRIFFLVLSVLSLIVFYLFSVQVKKERFKQINFDTTVRLQHKLPERFDEIFEDLAFFVSPAISSGLVILLTVIALVSFKQKRMHPTALIIPLAFLLLVGVEVYGKDRVESPAPPFFMIKNPTTLFPKYHVIDQYSYPSGHAARALFVAGVTGLLIWKKIRNRLFFPLAIIGLLSLVLLISIGKIHLGQHWLSDILGGWILASAFLFLVSSVHKPI